RRSSDLFTGRAAVTGACGALESAGCAASGWRSCERLVAGSLVSPPVLFSAWCIASAKVDVSLADGPEFRNDEAGACAEADGAARFGLAMALTMRLVRPADTGAFGPPTT